MGCVVTRETIIDLRLCPYVLGVDAVLVYLGFLPSDRTKEEAVWAIIVICCASASE